MPWVLILFWPWPQSQRPRGLERKIEIIQRRSQNRRVRNLTRLAGKSSVVAAFLWLGHFRGSGACAPLSRRGARKMWEPISERLSPFSRRRRRAERTSHVKNGISRGVPYELFKLTRSMKMLEGRVPRGCFRRQKPIGLTDFGPPETAFSKKQHRNSLLG